ncbi:MAG: sulfurtransferase TusA family protein [Rhizobium sp.]|nr:sulfurtransferase TusA family protein [Rhizobium sp.]
MHSGLATRILWQWIGRSHRQERRVNRQELLPNIGPVCVAYVVDCSGEMCPRPQLLTRKIVEQARTGDVIEVISDNPAFVESFPWLADALLCSRLATIHDADRWRMYLRKGYGG